MGDPWSQGEALPGCEPEMTDTRTRTPLKGDVNVSCWIHTPVRESVRVWRESLTHRTAVCARSGSPDSFLDASLSTRAVLP